MKTALVNSGEVRMIRSVLKLGLIVIVLVGLGAFILGRWSSGGAILPDSPVGASGPVDTSKARDVGAKVGEATANAANQAKDALANGSVTAKIKSKMALDDLVKARNIDVDTNGSVVTLTGVVRSQAERQRAVQLAKETEGVTSVIDHLRLQ
jgi:BON domain